MLTFVSRLQEETARVEEHLLGSSFTDAIINCFATSKANAFENLLEPLQKLLRLSPPIALTLAHPDLFSRIHVKLQSNKALMRLNLLRIMQSICDASDEQGAFINTYGLYDTIQRLAETDNAVLVRDMARKLVKSCKEYEKLSKSSGKHRNSRRISSSSTTPPSLMSNHSTPPTPTSVRVTHSLNSGIDRETRESRQRSIINGPIPFRPTRDEAMRNSSPAQTNGSGMTPKSKLPRTTSGRSSRQSMLPSSKKEDNTVPTTSSQATPSIMIPNSRRRRQVSGDARWT